MADFATLAALQQLLGGITSQEEEFLMAELARRMILSGTQVDANGLIYLGTVTASFSSLGVSGTLTVNNAAIVNGEIRTLSANTISANTANIRTLTSNQATITNLNVATGNVTTLTGNAATLSNIQFTYANGTTLKAIDASANTFSANTVTANNLILPIV
ncbi:MAG: hypothetical protein ACOYD0_11865 [Candidatus Nanopelagicales bacterium]